MSTVQPFDNVAIVGLGLMGGSLARALKRLPDPPRVRASTTETAVVDRARADAAADQVTLDPQAAIEGADLVIYATPVGVTIDLVREHAPLLSSAVVTDVGSVKQPVMEAAVAAGIADRFVGGHPMCGSERAGYGSGAADLYTGATVWLVAGSVNAPVASVVDLWRSVGAVPRVIDASAHDRLVAWTSHLPQLLASVLGAVLGAADVPPDSLGPGGREMTRLTRSPSALWADILLQNRRYVTTPVAETARRLDVLTDALKRGDRGVLERLFEDARAWAGET